MSAASTAAPQPGLRVVSLLPSATDTAVALGMAAALVGRSHECDAAEAAHLPAVTSSRLGDSIPVEEIDAVMSASAAAVREMAQLGPALAFPLLEYGEARRLLAQPACGAEVRHLSLHQHRKQSPRLARYALPPSAGLTVYHLHVERLQQLRPDVVLTCLQTAHGAVMSGELLSAALHAVLGYEPRVVHCAAEDLEGVWRDEQASRAGVAARNAKGPAAAACSMQRRHGGPARVDAGGAGPTCGPVLSWS